MLSTYRIPTRLVFRRLFVCSSCQPVSTAVALSHVLHRQRYLWELKRYASKQRGKRKFVEPVIVKQTKSAKRTIDVYPDMTARELADVLGANFDDVVETLVSLDKNNLDTVAEDRQLDKEHITKVVFAYDGKPRLVSRPKRTTNEDNHDIQPLPSADHKDCVKRAPVVTIMGHVDHGKTTLLDALRSSRITEGEFGGITQHIGAFSVDLKGLGRRVTFLDTPGHAAFAAMRERGARATDIVVLVVAADDGVKEQTVQSIRFAQEAGVPIVVAVNKIDKPGADPQRAKRSLLEHNVVVEDLGGDVQAVEVSALYSKNLPALQEALLMQADVMELKATPKGPVEGIVIESSVQHGIGKLCTVLVTRGTLKKGEILVAGNAWCKVRTMTDEYGKPVSAAGPSTPVRVSGWKEDLPAPGERIVQTANVDRAQKVVDYRMKKEMEAKAKRDWDAIAGQREEERSKYLANRQKLLDVGMRYGSTLRRIVHREQRLERDGGEEGPKLNIMLRTDVEGTLEAILEVLNTYESEKCKLQIVDFGVGPPTEKDVEIAKETGALIYTFNVSAPSVIKSHAERDSVRVENYNVIYRLVDGLKAELSSRLPSLTELELVGEGHVLKEFMISDRARKRQPIAGVLIDWGNFNKNCVFRFLRAGNAFFEGSVESLKCDQEVVTNAKTNTEVGIALENKNIRFKEDDTVEVYEKKEVRQEIDWYPAGF